MPRTFKELLATDQLIRVFALARVIHPVVVEMFGLSGKYHGFWLDQEHAQITSEQIVVMSLAARANQMDCFVRVPPAGYWQITQCLEAGAGGVMGAQIQSADHARQFLSWAKYAPAGMRGLNSSGRDADYTHKSLERLVHDANRDVFVAIQIETTGAVDEADAIAALDGVDLLFVGPADLSLALGVVGQFHHEKLWEAIEKVSRACRNRRKAWGCVAPDPEFASRAVDLGCRMPTIGNDPMVLRQGIEALEQAFERQFRA